MTYPRTDLLTCTPRAFQECLDYAFDLGRRAEMDDAVALTARQLADLLTTRRRQGHERALLEVYKAARFHIRTMGAS